MPRRARSDFRLGRIASRSHSSLSSTKSATRRSRLTVARLVMAGPGPAIRFLGTHLTGSADPQTVHPTWGPAADADGRRARH
jgi:hypothetical protein